jgi:hypothetical protein
MKRRYCGSQQECVKLGYEYQISFPVPYADVSFCCAINVVIIIIISIIIIIIIYFKSFTLLLFCSYLQSSSLLLTCSIYSSVWLAIFNFLCLS